MKFLIFRKDIIQNFITCVKIKLLFILIGVYLFNRLLTQVPLPFLTP